MSTSRSLAAAAILLAHGLFIACAPPDAPPRARGPYRVRIGEREREAHVPEAAVQSGAAVVVRAP